MLVICFVALSLSLAALAAGSVPLDSGLLTSQPSEPRDGRGAGLVCQLGSVLGATGCGCGIYLLFIPLSSAVVCPAVNYHAVTQKAVFF